MSRRGVKLIWGLCVLFSALGGFLLSANTAQAETPKVIISEVQYHPENPSGISSQEKEYEWFELYNPSDIDLDLKDWTIKDNTDTSIIPDLIIKSKEYAVVTAKKTAFEENFPGLSINIVELTEGKIGNGLANSADELSLFDDQNTMIDKIVWVKDFGLGVSVSRDEITKELYKISAPHPGFIPIVQIYSDKLKINEILPNPETGDEEFIELFNSSDEEIDLKNWQIDDGDGGSSPYTLSDTLNPKSYLVLNQAQTKIFFNDDGDMVRLFDPNGAIKDSVSYEKAASGLSFSKFEDGWFWTQTPTSELKNIKKITPNTSNIVLSDQPAVDKTIEEAKNLELDEAVIISGQVTVSPGILSSQYFYLEDSTGGIQVYDYGKDFPEIKEGSTLSVTGTLSETHGEKRLKIENANSVTVANPAESTMTPEPIDQPAENLVGKLVSVKGKISKNSGGNIYLENQDPSFRVYILAQTNIEKPKLHKGDEIEVTGILSYYQSYYRLLPRYQEDIRVLSGLGLGGGEEDETLPESGSDTSLIFKLALILVAILKVLSIFFERAFESRSLKPR